MWLQNTSAKPQISPNHLVMAGAGICIGGISSLLGIGGGTLSVPFLTFYGYPMRNAVAISAACGIPIAVAGSLGYAFLVNDNSALPTNSLGFIYLPAFPGSNSHQCLLRTDWCASGKAFTPLNPSSVCLL